MFAQTTKNRWKQDSAPLHGETLLARSHLHTDVCIVGWGIAGLSVAYFLMKAGLRVTVLERDALGSGETGRTTAHLSNALDDRYTTLERLFGRQGAKLAAESHTAAIQIIENIVRTHEIACDFERVDGYLFAHAPKMQNQLQQEAAAARRAGLAQVEWVPHAPCLSTTWVLACASPSKRSFIR